MRTSSHKSLYSATKAIMNVLFTFALAHAHGPPLAPIGIVAADHDAHSPIVLLTEGLAQRVDTPSGWRFLCPALWGGLPDAPLVSQTSSGVLAHGLTDGYLLIDDGTSQATNQPEINALRVIDTAGRGTQALALIREEMQDALWRIEPPSRIEGLPGRTTSLVWHEGSVLVTALDGEGGLLLLTLDPEDGSERERFVWPSSSSAIPHGRSDGQSAWIVSKTEDIERVERWGKLPGQAAAESSSTISGPLATGDRVLAGLNQTLHQLVEDSWVPIDGATPLQCLAQTSEHLLVCSDDQLLVVDAQGKAAEVFFDVQDLAAPELDRLPPDLASDCEVEWYRALSDMGRTPAQPTLDTGVTKVEESCGGCNSTARPHTAFWLLMVCLRRRRKA